MTLEAEPLNTYRASCHATSGDPPEDIFDPRHYARARLPASEAETLPSWCYTSPAFHRREVERLFLPGWNCVGRAERWASPGDYAAFELVGVPVLVLRGRDGALRAFANTCRHRGSRLLDGEGKCRAIKCPYHGWVYDLDGRLVGAPDMEESLGFARDDYGLVPIRLETWDGFAFITLDANAPGLLDYLGDCPAIHAPYGLADMGCVRRREFEIACNWKLYPEVSMEYYHLKSAHPRSIAPSFHDPDPPDRVAGQFATVFGLTDGSVALMAGQGHKGFPVIETLAGRLRRGTRYSLIYPGSILCCTTDAMWFFESYPLGPERTKLAVSFCFPRKTIERRDFAQVVEGYYERWDRAIEEDNAVLERQQRGLASPLSRAGRLSHLEAVVGIFGKWIVERVIGADSQG